MPDFWSGDMSKKFQKKGWGLSLKKKRVQMNPVPLARGQGGRGKALATCGDVEQNPGPTPAMEVDETNRYAFLQINT